MTKEELEKEAEEYYEDETEGTFQICEDCYWFADAVQTAYVDSAEPREKRIAELEAQLEREKNLNQCLSDNNEQLREQIEEMKRDVKGNIKWADQNKNDQMWQKLVKMYNQWS